ncbi:hypothetical protein [Nonomuraea aurantiaca]|uniref:hypothetical protein n=1 Tax=Nonomuraea aurantiaca TaxID=2878562 RepID=UPI001CD94587|nr:hypothetical protein [Nonomuraea aurantiaca]MCA2221890.1 hypothetical protein [Nonomuraea aurantiaca]
MCGACGERGDADWARPWVAGPGARAAVARAVTRVRPSPGVRVSPSGGGWLVARPTGGAMVCATLGELVAAVSSASSGSATGPPDLGRSSGGEPAGAAGSASFGLITWLDPAHASGRLSVPAADGRTGIVLRVDPLAPPSPALGAAPVDAAVPDIAVPDEAAALAVLAELATPPWLRRLYLERVEGVSASWGRPLDGPSVPPPRSAALAADAVVRLEWARQAGRFDDTAFALSCPLDDDAALLDVEIRAGHVVRARTQPYGRLEVSGSGAC